MVPEKAAGFSSLIARYQANCRRCSLAFPVELSGARSGVGSPVVVHEKVRFRALKTLPTQKIGFQRFARADTLVSSHSRCPEASPALFAARRREPGRAVGRPAGAQDDGSERHRETPTSATFTSPALLGKPCPTQNCRLISNIKFITLRIITFNLVAAVESRGVTHVSVEVDNARDWTTTEARLSCSRAACTLSFETNSTLIHSPQTPNQAARDLSARTNPTGAAPIPPMKTVTWPSYFHDTPLVRHRVVDARCWSSLVL